MQPNPLEIKKFMQTLCTELGNEFIVIGGWAVHAYHCKDITFDGDAMISYSAEGTLRDSYILTKNARMKKSQFKCAADCDIDLYVEHQHGLRVPFDELQAYANQLDGMTVACPEHLLILKIDAFKDRRHVPKGEKDKEDLIQLIDRAPFENKALLEQHLEKEDIAILNEVANDRTAMLRICKQNAKEAKETRGRVIEKMNGLLPQPIQPTNEKSKTRPGKNKDSGPNMC